MMEIEIWREKWGKGKKSDSKSQLQPPTIEKLGSPKAMSIGGDVFLHTNEFGVKNHYFVTGAGEVYFWEVSFHANSWTEGGPIAITDQAKKDEILGLV